MRRVVCPEQSKNCIPMIWCGPQLPLTKTTSRTQSRRSHRRCADRVCFLGIYRRWTSGGYLPGEHAIPQAGQYDIHSGFLIDRSIGPTKLSPIAAERREPRLHGRFPNQLGTRCAHGQSAPAATHRRQREARATWAPRPRRASLWRPATRIQHLVGVQAPRRRTPAPAGMPGNRMSR